MSGTNITFITRHVLQILTPPMSNQAPVSVIIPAYNAERFIALTLQSIFAQTLLPAEVIVVDDGSVDRTFEIAREYDVWIVRQSNRGLAAARNAGIKVATQPWIAFMDADDLWARNKLEQQLNASSLCPEAAMISCDYHWMESRGQNFALPPFDLQVRRQYYLAHGLASGQSITLFKKVPGELFFLFPFPLLPSAVLVKREAIVACGLFDEKLRRSEDLECFLRVLANRSLLIIDQPLASYRRHEDNLSNNVLEMHLALEEVGEMINLRGDMYVAGVSEVLQRFCGQVAVKSGRQSLDRQQYVEARQLFSLALRKKYSWRPALLYLFSYSPQVVFTGALKIKRALVRLKVMNEAIEFGLLKKLRRRAGKATPVNALERTSSWRTLSRSTD
jgi:glycosyltransferase involved in cell wall biosynthesis